MFFQKGDFKILFTLAIPLILSGVVESSIGFVSTIFLAHLGSKALAAGSLTVWFFATLMVIMWGVLTAVSVLVSRYDGANNTKAVSLVLRDSLWLCCLLVIPTTLLIWNMAPILTLLGQKPAIVAEAVPYLHALAWGILPDFVGLALLQFLIGLGQTQFNLLFTVCLVPLNILLNFVFIFGKFGLPAFGIAGLGWGASAAYWIITTVIIVFICLHKRYQPYWQAIRTFTAPLYLWELIKVGLPMGLMYCLEIGFFFVMSLIMGHFGTNELAANQLTVQYVGFFVTLVFSIAQAVTVRMSNQIGAGRPEIAHRAAYAGIICSFSVILLVALMEWIAPRLLLAVDYHSAPVDNVEMLNMAVSFMAIAAIFQLSESVRLTLFGALRALKDTRFTLLTSLLSFWGIAIPLGYCFANFLSLHAYGYWWGLVASGLFSASLLYWRYRIKIKVYLKN